MKYLLTIFQTYATIVYNRGVHMNKYQKTTEKKKQAIIQAALQLFKEKGFKDTSIKSIAEAAEVSPVSIYNYFGSKDNLVALCVNDLFEEITQQAEDILNIIIVQPAKTMTQLNCQKDQKSHNPA